MKKAIAFAALLALGGCASSAAQGPVGIGSGVNELKRSPCACVELEQVIPEGYAAAVPA